MRGVSAVVTVVTGKTEELPHVILDSDKPGQEKAKNLRNDRYRAEGERILMAGDFCEKPDAEIEDLFPVAFLADMVTRFLPRQDDDFDARVVTDVPLVPQIERYAATHSIKLAEGWKVDLARQVKNRLLRDRDPLAGETTQSPNGWSYLQSSMLEAKVHGAWKPISWCRPR